MISRKEAVAIIKRQFSTRYDDGRKPHKYHYGVVELRELMDAIYGGQPTSPDEFVESFEGKETPALERLEEIYSGIPPFDTPRMKQLARYRENEVRPTVDEFIDDMDRAAKECSDLD